jgi:hypothetical protein
VAVLEEMAAAVLVELYTQPLNLWFQIHIQ